MGVGVELVGLCFVVQVPGWLLILFLEAVGLAL